MSAVENEQAETALIPVENNLAGRVADMHFLLEKISLKIVAEHYHKIEHHLLAKKNSKVANINNVYSHSHALSQCRNNLKKFNLNPVHFIDTAGAAKFVSESEDASLAAIAPMSSTSITETLRSTTPVLEIIHCSDLLSLILRDLDVSILGGKYIPHPIILNEYFI